MTDPIGMSSAPLGGTAFGGEEEPVPVDIDEIFNGVTFHYDGEISLNPEMVLHMVRRRLRDLDSQISGATDQLEQNTQRAELLTKQQQVLTAIRGAAASEGKIQPDQEFDIDGMMIEIDGTEMLASAWLERVGLDPTKYPRSGTKIADLESRIENIKSLAGRANSGNEMLMLQIQTLTQQRSQVIQLGTSLIKKIDDSSMAIARNV